MAENEALGSAILGDQGDTVVFHRRGVALGTWNSLHDDFATVRGVGAEDCAQQLRASRTEHPRDAENLPLGEVERDVAQRSGTPEATYLEYGAPSGRKIGGPTAVRHLPEHHRHDPLGPRLFGIEPTDQLTVSEDGNRVGDTRQLLKAVRDVEDRNPVARKGADNAKELLDLVVGKGGGRLIQDEHPGIASDGNPVAWGSRARSRFSLTVRPGTRVGSW